MAIIFPSSDIKKVAGSITATLLLVKLCLREDDKSQGKRNNRLSVLMSRKRIALPVS
ncbi:hypothetical protein A678_00311 [Salmonella enterica subsp. enterica serovar Enteritidis str. 2010K-0271]|nr:hypothetical protein A678_00311 [Salmonella enterica subsp. enterica serovar Enteritidis str. 2010K-0271]